MSTLIQWQNGSLRHSISSCNYPLILLFALLIAQCKAQTNYPYTIIGFAPGNQTYTYGDQFGTNLNNVLDDLVQNTPSTGLNVSSNGESPNRVYGLLQCRGDASQKECYDCCQTVRGYVTILCKNKTECRMWFLMCELYYRNDSSFIASPSTFTGLGPMIVGPFMEGPDLPFINLVSNLSIEASSSIKRFAAGTSVDSSGHKIYALVECYRVISASNCSNCLANATEPLQTRTYISASVYMDTCYVLLSNQSFSANQSGKLPMQLGVGRAVLLLIVLLLLLM